MAAALTAAQAGVPVLLAGPPPAPADRPGETLSASACAVLDELGLAGLLTPDLCRPNLVTHAAWGLPVLAQRHAAMHPEGGGVVLDRPAFEAALAREVAARGIPWLPAHLVAAERTAAGTWRAAGAAGETVTAAFLIDATGRPATFARHLTRRFRADRLVAAWQMLRQSDADVEPTPATLIEAVPGGWWYACLLPDQRLSLAYFSEPDLLPRGLSRDAARWRALAGETGFIRRWLESATFEVSAPPRLASAATTWLAPAAGPGWAAAGDAACAFDPLSSHGMATALWTGRRAASAALAALAGEEAPLAAYAQGLAGGITDFLLQRRRVYGAERRWPDAAFWARRQRGT